MFRIFMTNFGYWRDETFETLREALDFGKSKGFEFSVANPIGDLVASWSPIGGIRTYN